LESEWGFVVFVVVVVVVLLLLLLLLLLLDKDYQLATFTTGLLIHTARSNGEMKFFRLKLKTKR
jgi:hypothetical protein